MHTRDEDARGDPAVATTQGPARARSVSPADARESWSVVKDRADRTSVKSRIAQTRRHVMDKPPSPHCSRSSLFLIGRNSRGNWVVRDQKGLCGGLFVDRAEALKFARFENGHRPQAVIMVPGTLELDIGGTPRGSDPSSLRVDVPHSRAA